jgi:hypothetical protein
MTSAVDDQSYRPNPGGDPSCTCRNPVCSKPHSASGPVIVRLDFMEAWFLLAAAQRWNAALGSDSYSRPFVRRGIATMERAMFGRAEAEVVADYLEVQAKMLAEAE